jgi:hypothetical protein
MSAIVEAILGDRSVAVSSAADDVGNAAEMGGLGVSGDAEVDVGVGLRECPVGSFDEEDDEHGDGGNAEKEQKEPVPPRQIC